VKGGELEKLAGTKKSKCAARRQNGKEKKKKGGRGRRLILHKAPEGEADGGRSSTLEPKGGHAKKKGKHLPVF